MSIMQDTERKNEQSVDGAMSPAFQTENGVLNAVLALFTIVSGTVMLGYFAQAHAIAGAKDYLERYPVSTLQQTALSEFLSGSVWESLATLFLLPAAGLIILGGLMFSRWTWATVAAIGFILLGVTVAIMGEQIIR